MIIPPDLNLNEVDNIYGAIVTDNKPGFGGHPDNAAAVITISDEDRGSSCIYLYPEEAVKLVEILTKWLKELEEE